MQSLVRMLHKTVFWALPAVVFPWALGTTSPRAEGEPVISLPSLLSEMLDRSALTQWPCPSYSCRQASSYDRASISPEDGWFANDDCSKFLRQEDHSLPDGQIRKEWVLMDAAGPGAIVRFWITAPKYVNNLYFYIDDSDEPVIAGPSDQVIGGDLLVGAPLSQVTARGQNLYLPIPYKSHIKVTCDKIDEQPQFYYQINYRTFLASAAVESFSNEVLTAAKEKIAETNALLANPAGSFKHPDSVQNATVTVNPGDTYVFPALLGPACISEVTAKLSVDGHDAPNDPKVVQALRSLVLSAKFDDKETVCVPMGDFFGSGIGVNPYQTWYTTVMSDGTMISRWQMPYKNSAVISLINRGTEPVTLTGSIGLENRPWSSDSLYFHCQWRQERGIQTVAANGTRDWSYLNATGTGIYVGDILSVVNRDRAWWGEGDEKFLIDDDIFPSHFGTGSEDYYGYAWCCPEFFESPWRAQPRAEGPDYGGNVTNLRFRSLDAIPFRDRFRGTIEIWHWSATIVDYAVAVFWYGDPNAASEFDRQALLNEAGEKVSYTTSLILIPGFKTTKETARVGGKVTAQDMTQFGSDWHNNRQLFYVDGAVGDKIGLIAESRGAKTLKIGLTAACDYGIVQVYVDGQPYGAPLDLYNADKVIRRVQMYPLPENFADGEHTVEFKITGKNECSSGLLFGTDGIRFE